jgi:hypothetical protein
MFNSFGSFCIFKTGQKSTKVNNRYSLIVLKVLRTLSMRAHKPRVGSEKMLAGVRAAVTPTKKPN